MIFSCFTYKIEGKGGWIIGGAKGYVVKVLPFRRRRRFKCLFSLGCTIGPTH